MSKGLGENRNCFPMLSLKPASELTFDTTIPAAVEMMSAGIWATSPSPTVRSV